MIAISTINKLETKIRKRPTPNDITFDEFDRFLRHYGFVQKKNRGTSHVSYVYSQNGIIEILTFTKPHGSSDGIEEPYIIDALKLIERIDFCS